MSYTNEEFGKQLNIEITKGFDIVRISRWAFVFFSNHLRELNNVQRNILEELFRMEDDPQFEYTEQELRMLAEKLINNEKNALAKIIEMKSKKI